jgi:hypothetical protein
MPFPPNTKTTIYTQLDESDVLEQLRWVIEPKRLFSLFGGFSKPYQGTIAGSFFTVSRNKSWSRTRLEIKGKVNSEPYGSSIELELDSSPLKVEGVLALVMTIIFVSIMAIFSGFAEGEQPGDILPLWIPPIFFLAWYTIEYFGFITEWNISKKYFLEFFEAQETPIED